MALSRAAAALVAAGGLTDIDQTLFFSTFVLFLVFAVVLGKFAWKPLLKMIEEREREIRDAVDGAQKASADAQALLEKHKELLREAGREREEILKRAVQEADTLKAELQEKARSESEQMVERAREEVLREKATAILELRKEVADLAISAAAKIVTSSLSTDTQRKLVDEFVAQLSKAR